MNNPYKPPTSVLLVEEKTKQYRPAVIWKLYFWLSVILALLMALLFSLEILIENNLVPEFTESDDFTLLDVFDFVLWSISLLAVYGMAWSRKKINRIFWFVFFYVFLIWTFIYGFVFPFSLEIPTYGTLTQLDDLIFELPFTFAHSYVLYRYVFTMNYIWRPQHSSGGG